MSPLRRAGRFLALVVCCGAVESAAAAETLIPAVFNQLHDTQGYSWQITPNGSIGNDQRGTIGNAFTLAVGGGATNFGPAQMTPDGLTYVFAGAPMQQFAVSRRVRLDLKQSLVQYVDTVKNTSSQPQTLSLMLHTQLGNPAQAFVNETGASLNPSSTSQVAQAIAVAQNGVPSLVLYFGSAKSKTVPTVTIQNNYRVTATFTTSVAAGKAVSFVYGFAIAGLQGVPDARSAANLFKPFTSSTWQRAVPAELRGGVINGGVGTFNYGEALDQLESPDALKDLGVERGPHDQLLAGEATRLRGALAGGVVSIEAKRGAKKLGLERVAALFGGDGRGRVPRVVLRDGQVLVGPLEVADLKFTLNSGLDVTCDLAKLDRFVLKEEPDDGKAAANVFCYVDSLEGDRLAVTSGDRQAITALTNWGECEIALDEIDVWVAGSASQGRISHRLLLRDGSTFTAMVTDGTLELATVEYGPQPWSVFDIRRLYSAHRGAASHKDPSAPHVVTLGDNLFVGQVDLPLLHVSVQGQVVPVPPAQVKSLRREETDAAPGAQSLPFRVELWDGDVAVGTLVEQVLPVRSVGGLLQIPVTDLVEVRVPTPTVPDSLRGRITELIAELGHAEWTRREAAAKELRSLGGVVREQCDDALKATTDPEVRKRLQALLDALKEE